jgi:hypothetical protein
VLLYFPGSPGQNPYSTYNYLSNVRTYVTFVTVFLTLCTTHIATQTSLQTYVLRYPQPPVLRALGLLHLIR